MSHVFWLSDEAWACLKPHLPHVKPRVDDRRVISGILHMLETGRRSGDVPAELSLDSTHVKAHRSAAGARPRSIA